MTRKDRIMQVLSNADITNEDFLWAAKHLPGEASSADETASANEVTDDTICKILQLSQPSVKAVNSVYSKIESFVDECMLMDDGHLSNEKLLKFAKKFFTSEDFMILFAVSSPLIIAQALAKYADRGVIENMSTLMARIQLLEVVQEVGKMTDPSALFQPPKSEK